MERRVLLAVILSFLVLYGFQALFPPAPDQTAQPQKPVQSRKPETAPNASAPAASNPAPSIQPPAPLPAESGAPQVPARDIVVDNAAVHALFTRRADVLKHWRH